VVPFSAPQADIRRAGLVAAVEQSADTIVITDTSGTIRYVNPAFTALTGCGSEETVGQPASLLKSDRRPPGFYKHLWDTITARQVWHGEIINRSKDGALYTEEMRITPVRDSAGTIVSYIAVKQDVARAAGDAQRFLASIVESS
jgi:PAS domain S-box-containing protein